MWLTYNYIPFVAWIIIAFTCGRPEAHSLFYNKTTVDYNAIAISAADWIVSEAISVSDGVYWPDHLIGQVNAKYNRSLDLYSGVAGTVFFLLEAHRYDATKSYLTSATKGADYLLSRLPPLLARTGSDTGLYHGGLAGIGHALLEVYDATQQDSYLKGALNILNYVNKVGGTTGELETQYKYPLRFGTAGVGFWCLDIYKKTNNAQALELAKKAGNWLISVANHPREGGLKWFSGFAPGMEMPNYAEGTSGIAFFLATLYNVTSDKSYLDAAIGGALYLQAIADTTNHGCAIWHDNANKDLIYMTECQGPPGTGRLWVRLYQVTGNATWLEWARASAKTLIDHGKQTGKFNWYYFKSGKVAPFWDNVGQCDGSSAVIEYMLLMYKISGDDNYFNFAQQVADDMVSRGTKDPKSGGMYWIVEEDRTSPASSRGQQVGYMEGAAGIGSVLFWMGKFMEGNTQSSPRLCLPDSPRNFGFDPYGDKC